MRRSMTVTYAMRHKARWQKPRVAGRTFLKGEQWTSQDASRSQCNVLYHNEAHTVP
jgi:hypothetical protein